MVTLTKARYEQGVLRPLQHIPLAEGQEVQIVLYLPDAGLAAPAGMAGLPARHRDSMTDDQLRQLEQAARRRPLFGTENASP
jgi:predicted DNA-binding antitoxin AbrB/MazE fold protein